MLGGKFVEQIKKVEMSGRGISTSEYCCFYFGSHAEKTIDTMHFMGCATNYMLRNVYSGDARSHKYCEHIYELKSATVINRCSMRHNRRSYRLFRLTSCIRNGASKTTISRLIKTLLKQLQSFYA